MLKVRMLVRPVGYISLEGQPLSAWPPVGSVVELPDVAARDLVAAGRAERATARASEWLWPWRRPRPETVAADITVRIKRTPSGHVSLDGGPLTAWPKVGEVIALPELIARDLIAGGFAEESVADAAVDLVIKSGRRRAP